MEEIFVPHKEFNDYQDMILKQWPKFFFPALLAVIALWLATGFYMVSPGEVGLIRRFGHHVETTQPGLRYRIPWPVDSVTIVNLERVRRVEIGFRSGRSSGMAINQRVAEESLMLTGDENIIEAQLIVQYQVKDPAAYAFNVYQPEVVLHTSAEVALRSAAGGMTIDELLTVGREKLQVETQNFLQRLLDAYQTGLRVTEVRLQVVDPPDQVKDAFHEVVRAREDRERLINQAQGYREDVIPKARGRAEQMLREAEAYKQERVLRAEGDAARFTALLEEYEKAKDVTRTRLHLETVESVLSGVRKVLVDPKAAGGVQGILPIGKLRLADAPAVSGKEVS